MKTSKFYTEERSSAVEKMEAIVDSAKVEGRELSDSETKEFDSLNEKANSLEGMAKRAASFEALQANKAAKSEPVAEENTPKEIREFSFAKAMEHYQIRMMIKVAIMVIKKPFLARQI